MGVSSFLTAFSEALRLPALLVNSQILSATLPVVGEESRIVSSETSGLLDPPTSLVGKFTNPHTSVEKEGKEVIP